MGKMGSKLGNAARMHNAHGFARPITTRTFTCHFTSQLPTQTLNRIQDASEILDFTESWDA